jgi:hypothetical protein
VEAHQLRQNGLFCQAVSKQLNTNFRAVYRALNGNGTPSTLTSLERAIVIGEPVSAFSEYPSTPQYQNLQQQVDHLQQQIDVLTAFMGTIQQQLAYHPNSTPRVAVDVPDRLRAYAKAHGMQVREVIDLALRHLFAEAGGEGTHPDA